MEIRGITNSSRIEGLDSLSQMRLHPDATVTSLVRFAFNLRSVSFVLVEAPTEWGIGLGQKTMRTIKVRCIDPLVEFVHYARCLPRIGRLTFDDSPDDAFVDIDGFAYIRCKKVIVKVEAEDVDYPTKEPDNQLID